MEPDGRVSGIGADVEAEGLGVRTAEVDAVEFVNPGKPGLQELCTAYIELDSTRWEKRQTFGRNWLVCRGC